MADDIVTRLRTALDEMELGCLGCSIINLNDHDHNCLTQNAADEIERLRQKEFMWKMTAVKLAGKMLPFSLLMNETEREEIQIVLQEAMNND